jgi:hypothetical protein
MSEATCARITPDERTRLGELIALVRAVRVLAEAGQAYVEYNAGSQLEGEEMCDLFGAIRDRAHEAWSELDDFATGLAEVDGARAGDGP